MTLDLSGLSSGKKAAWQPLSSTFLARHGAILAFDQSILATGWVVISNETTLGIHDAGSFGEPRVTKGWEDTLTRATAVCERIHDLVVRWQHEVSVVVHESPPVGGQMARPESSAMTALGVRLAARAVGLPIAMVSSQRAKSLLTGNHNAKKAALKAPLEALGITGYTPKITNQAQRDALAVAIAWLHDHA